MPKFGKKSMPIKIVYYDKGKCKKKTVCVPRIFFEAITNQGETKLSALNALYGIREYHQRYLANGLEKIIADGRNNVPIALLLNAAQQSYKEHAGIVATNEEMSKGLMLDNPDVDALARRVAAMALGLAPDQKLVSRTVIKITSTPTIKMRKVTIRSGDSSEQGVEVSVPESTIVKETRESKEERIPRMPDVSKALDDLFSKIESVRGTPLDRVERDVVVAHININYVGREDCKIPVTI